MGASPGDDFAILLRAWHDGDVLGAEAQSDLAQALGARMDDGGELQVDSRMQTSVEGLYAVGDVVSGLNQISVAVGHAALAATAVHRSLPANPRERARGLS